jgi:cell division septum initiation protein DivIVA
MLSDEDKHWITERLEQMQERLKEYTDQRAEVIETRMLRALRNFAHPVEAAQDTRNQGL